MITGSTRVFALLGDPVAHSVSPAMYNAAFQVLGLSAAYVPLRCRSEDVAPLMRALVRAGGGGNVTIPHKLTAAEASDRLTPEAAASGAVNTFWGDGDAVVGDSTDAIGLARALARLDPPPGPWLVAGTGGAARAAVLAAQRAGVALAVRSRAAARGAEFARWASEEQGVASADAAECRVIINATPLGLKTGDPHPVPLTAAPGARVALDLVYRAGETEWVRALRAQGITAADGREMLVAQGAAAFERWFPGVAAPVEVMRAAVRRALG